MSLVTDSKPLPQQLRDVQEQMSALLLTRAGYGVLDNEAAWKRFAELKAPALKEASREGLFLYEELLKGGIHETLSNIFPYTCRFFTAEGWIDLTERYRRTHPNESYQLFRAVEAFPDFLAASAKSGLIAEAKTYPFLSDLALYEWLEVAVQNAEDSVLPEAVSETVPGAVEELAAWKPVWNPVYQYYTFAYDVPVLIQRLEDMECSTSLSCEEHGVPDVGFDMMKPLTLIQPESTAMLIYRDPETLRARFFKLNALTAAFFSGSQDVESYRKAFIQLKERVSALQSIDEDTVFQQGLNLLATCQKSSILLGSIRVSV